VTLPLADITFSTDGDVVVASVRGEIDMSNAGDIGEAIGRKLSNEEHAFVFDLTACEYVDSAGIQLIYELQEKLRNRGQDIRVVIAPGALIGEALRLTDIPRVVGAADTVEAALTSLRST
jgi:anti-sigma B factor antagonist